MDVLKSTLIGSSIGAIPEIIFFEIIRRTLTKGFFSGFLLSIGEFLGNFLVLLLIYFGLSNLFTFKLTNILLYVVGAILLSYIGINALKLTKENIEKSYKGKAIDRNSLIAEFIIAVTNPVAIALWLSLVGSYISEASKVTAIINLFFLAFGLILFYLAMVTVVNLTKHKIPTKYILLLSKLFGVILLSYSISFLYRFIKLIV
ncbi:MAG: LysE family transporter [Candidatus Daviesbacteria bacterium]|nr:LysE family transporter [Candidatus Daviesbacteria bacterium]